MNWADIDGAAARQDPDQPLVQGRLPYYWYLSADEQKVFDANWPGIVQWYADTTAKFKQDIREQARAGCLFAARCSALLLHQPTRRSWFGLIRGSPAGNRGTLKYRPPVSRHPLLLAGDSISKPGPPVEIDFAGDKSLGALC